MNAKENKRIQMWCNVPFHLPVDMEVIWRFAEEVCLEHGESFMVTSAPLKEYFKIFRNRNIDFLAESEQRSSIALSYVW